MKLSILICTIKGRENQFQALLGTIKKQLLIEHMQEVELLTKIDNKEISVGAKREALLNCAKGDYVVFIDDDDSVADDYIEQILKAIQHNPDCIGFKIECNMEGIKHKAIASNIYDDWCENVDGFKYCRTIYHKTPVRREIALQIGFKDMRFGEDYDYSKRLKASGLLKKEYFIDKYLYFYNYKFENPKTKYGINN
jgi:hypothetical protein